MISCLLDINIYSWDLQWKIDADKNTDELDDISKGICIVDADVDTDKANDLDIGIVDANIDGADDPSISAADIDKMANDQV